MDNRVNIARKRIDELFRRLAAGPAVETSALLEAIHEVSTVFEELHVALEEERRRYKELFDYAPEAYLVTDAAGVIREANHAASQLLNIKQQFLTGKPITLYVLHEDQKRLSSLLAPPRLLADQELKLQPRERSPIVASVSLSPEVITDGKSTLVRWLVRDITQQKVEQAALEASEERFRTVFSHARMGMVLVNLNGIIVEVNRAFQEMTGYLREELQGKWLEDLVYPADQPLQSLPADEMAERREAFQAIEKRFLDKADQVIWMRVSASVLPGLEGRPMYLVYTTENITAQKEAEFELAETKRRLMDSVEAERLRLAQDLHDGPLQDLYAVVFKLNSISADGGSGNEQEEDIKGSEEMIKVVAGRLRTICGDLRPPALANFGLDRAIQSDITKLETIKPEIRAALALDRDDGRLNQEVRLAMFRIYQQCLANVLRHASASLVRINLSIGDQEVVLSVADDGSGFEVPAHLSSLVREGHYGLAGIEERVHLLGGDLTVQSAPGEGTLIEVALPLR